MGRETLTIFTVFFLILFAFGSVIVLGGSTGSFDFWSVLNAGKNFFVDIPLFGKVISGMVMALVIYVLYREVRGGL